MKASHFHEENGNFVLLCGVFTVWRRPTSEQQPKEMEEKECLAEEMENYEAAIEGNDAV